MNKKNVYLYILFTILFCAEPIQQSSENQRDWEDFGLGYLFQGEAITAIQNSGRILDWDYNPSGGWKGYTYIPDLSFMIGLPGKTNEGAIYPWALRPSFYNPDTLVYWGPTVSESYLDRSSPTRLHSNFIPLEGYNYSGITVGTAYGNLLDYVDNSNPNKLLATSNLPYSWAIDEYGNFFWPGWLDPNGDFFSDQDTYLQFSDKDWLYSNDDGTNYNLQGYPTNIKVEMIASSYSTEELEDVIIFRAKLTNESEYDYTELYTGFYIDADILSGDLEGYSAGLHTNDDDMLNFNEELNIVYFYDYDGESGGVNPGYVGLMYIEDTQDNGLTGFRYFDWYSRPGVFERESSNNCCAGGPGRPVAEDMEAIQYALLSNDVEYPNKNISDWEWRNIESGSNPRQLDYNNWFFHPNPNNNIIDPNYDSIDAIYYSDAFLEGNEGLDVTTFMSSGPYDINEGETIEITFALVFGEDESDLLNNAQFIIDNQMLDTEDQQPKTVNLNLSYPNPFNPSTTISFDVIEYEFVSIKIYDLKGNLIDNLSEAYFKPGTHKITWNVKHNPSGKYIIKLETKSYTQSQIITLIK